MINACRSPGSCVLNREEPAKSLPKTQPETAIGKMAEGRMKIFQLNGMSLSGWACGAY